MNFINIIFYSLTVLFIAGRFLCSGQHFYNTHFREEDNDSNKIPDKLIWCTTTKAEQKKCENLAQAIERDKGKFKKIYHELHCYHAFTKDECMTMLDEEKVHVTTLDAGEVFIGGRYHSLIPIMQEVYEGGFKHYYSVAVVKKDTMQDVTSLKDLRGKKACFSIVGSLAGWVNPIYVLMNEGGMEIIDCNNHVKSAINFFGPSCAVNSLVDRYNPIGDNSHKLCQLCIGKIPGGKCTTTDPYAGFQGAFRCLLEAGEIAFLKHTTVEEMTSSDEFTGVSKDGFDLLCKDGTRQPLSEFRSCNWGIVPTHAVVTTSATTLEQRKAYQKFLEKVIQLYTHDPNTLQYNSTSDRNQPWNSGRDDRRDQYDPNRDQFADRTPDQDRNRFGSNRFKRQFDDQYNRDPYNRNRQDQNRDPNRDQVDSLNRNRNRNPFSRDNPDQFNRNQNQYNPYNSYNQDDQDDEDNDRDRYDDRNKNVGENTTESTMFYEKFNIFESVPKYGINHNLLFQDAARGLVSMSEHEQTYTGYLGPALDTILGVRRCPVNRMTMCVTSEAEHEKCIKMRTAMKAQLLKPEMICYNGRSQMNCMQSIKSGNADVALMDAGDIYTAGLNFDLIPFISEVYNLGKPEYYVVAVAKEEDPSTELTYLKGKYTCHTGINTAAGWVYPMAYLLSNGWIRPYGCNSIRAAAEYFTKSCVPGALSTEYNTGLPYDNMCDLCHGTSFRYCRRDASEDYFGHTGAFRCLVEGGGHVAFVKHTTVIENTGGKRREFWARDALADDFELLCPDGTRAEVNEYERCNLGKVMANAIVTRGGYGYNETEINAFINVFIYAQQFYGRKESNEFSFAMFYSIPPFSDLIFQDATQQLHVIDPAKRHYVDYLGPDFMRAQRLVQCNSGASSISAHLIGLFCMLAVLLWK